MTDLLIDPTTYAMLAIDKGVICEQCGKWCEQTHEHCCSAECLTALTTWNTEKHLVWQRLVAHYGSPEAVWEAAKKAFNDD